jgi:Cu2+-exporting ATPase
VGRPVLDPADAEPEPLRLAASLAATSRHPLSRALAAACPEAVPADGVVEHAGQGLSRGDVRLGNASFCGAEAGADATGPELFLVRPGHAPHRFRFADALRPDAATTVAALKRQGKMVILLSGDRAPVAARVAEELGIERWEAGLTPVDKVRRLESLAGQGRKAMMVGDGLNDAPALAAASVSMSPSSAVDLSRNAADVVFQGASLAAVTETLAIARRSKRLVGENIALAILYNALALPLAMAGWVTPLLAAIAMSSSSMLVIANALRLGRGR